MGKKVTTATIRKRGKKPNPNQIAKRGAIASTGVTFTNTASGITVVSTSENRAENKPIIIATIAPNIKPPAASIEVYPRSPTNAGKSVTNVMNTLSGGGIRYTGTSAR